MGGTGSELTSHSPFGWLRLSDRRLYQRHRQRSDLRSANWPHGPIQSPRRVARLTLRCYYTLKFDPIDRDLVREDLAKVEGRILRSEAIIARQRAEIARLQSRGSAVETDRALLTQFERLLELQMVDRDRLLIKLAAYDVV